MNDSKNNIANAAENPTNEPKLSPLQKVFKWCRRYLTVSLFLVMGFIAYILFVSDYSIIASSRSCAARSSRAKTPLNTTATSTAAYRPT